MICPVEISEVSAFRAAGVGEHGGHVLLHAGRDGADDESTGSDFAGQAAEIVGISDRQMRRWRERYEEFGFRGLFDRRRGKPSPKRVPVAVVEKVLGLYREKYFDLNVPHGVSNGDGERKDFSETDNCTQLSPGATCSITVMFSPTKTGQRNATLFIDDKGGGSPQTVALSGAGT
jgi:Helix-turn-helix domain